jgi:hypothetical protein
MAGWEANTVTSSGVVKWCLTGLALLLTIGLLLTFGLVLTSKEDNKAVAMGEVFLIDATEMPSVLHAARQGNIDAMLRLADHFTRRASASQGSSPSDIFFGNHIEERRARYWSLRALEAGDAGMASSFAFAYRGRALEANRSLDERKTYAIASLRYMLMADPCDSEPPEICAIMLRDGRAMLDVIEAAD